MVLLAEYVSCGHPDRLCDQIVNEIVNKVVQKNKMALCALECAVHTNKVFIDGRIAAGEKEPVINEDEIIDIVKNVYKKSGYGKTQRGDWYPYPETLKIICDLCIEPLSDDERSQRIYSDDQNIVTGYAVNIKETNYMPIEVFIAEKLGKSLENKMFGGPDFKLLIQLEKENSIYKWKRLTLSLQHKENSDFINLFSAVKNFINSELKKIFDKTKFKSLTKIHDSELFLNGSGDFIQGGPEGDNGLSGKKLCLDFYGPNIPIGGGAIYGKDPYKVDVCGAFKARSFAVELVKKLGFCSVFVQLAWSPGEKDPYIIEAYEIDEFGTKYKLNESLYDNKDSFSIEKINKDLNLSNRKIVSIKDIY